MLPYYVRLMRREDIDQVTEIDREAFPTMWASVNYRRELQNRLAHYIVAYDEEKTAEETKVKPSLEKSFAELVSRAGRLFNHDHFFGHEPSSSGGQYIIGFAGFWVLAGEAHIRCIAVREPCRRQGVGELLFISIINLAVELDVHIITLEVRVSNITAQRLYQKYGFAQVGLKHAYYTDNGEDAVSMCVGNINSASFQAHLEQLKQTHSKKWGIVSYQIAR